MEKNSEGLHRGLKNRHIQMIALGGAIGTGLFYGSAAAIQLAGPAITLSYFIGGVIIYLIMRMLGEMATEEPVSGAFSHFAYKYWGQFPGFLAGWNYWFLYIIISMAELTAVGLYVDFWCPSVPHWISALVVLVLITLLNLVNVKLYGEFEFWFAIIKVAAIIGMIVLGGVIIFGGLGGPASGFSNLWIHGGFAPHGIFGILLSLVVVMFSFGGIELIGITAGEADNPKKSIPQAINQVMWRIMLFYVGSLTVMMIIYPWNQVGMEGSPFVQIFDKLGISAAANILNIVVLTAALSVYNSGIYSNARMLFGLAEQGNAPKVFTKLSKNGVPVLGILVSSFFTLATVVLNYIFPGKIFMYIMSVAVSASLITWAMIIIINLKFRRAHADKLDQLIFKAPFHPYSNYLCLAFLGLILILMTQLDDMKIAAYILPLWLVIIYVGFKIKEFSGKNQSTKQVDI